MENVVVSLFDMELGPILFSLEIDLFHVQKVLVVLDINLLDFLLEHLRLVVFDKFVTLGFHIGEVFGEGKLLLGVCLNVFFEFGDLGFD